MRFCLEFQPAVEQTGGIGRYVRMLAHYLLVEKTDNELLSLFCLDFRRRLQCDGFEGADWRIFRLLPGRVMQKLWKNLHFPPFDWIAGSADVYHFTNFVAPPVRRGKKIATIFDMSFERFPECAEERNLLHLRHNLKKTISSSDLILTISKFSAEEIEYFHPQAAGRIEAVHLGIDESFRPSDHAEITEMRQVLNLERPYLVTVGTVEPRKNLEFLVEVFELLENPELDLVIAGKAGWKCEPIFNRMRSSRRSGQIRYVEHVPDRLLPALYSGAEIMITPSLYEGFGFPPLEAMACGTPVISSTGGSLPEVLGDKAVLLGLEDRDEWVTAISELLADSERQQNLCEAGITHAANYRWKNTARKTLELYRRSGR